MQVINGKASKVRNTVQINGGGGNSNQVTTTHISLFQLDGRQVKLKSNEPPLIDEDDSVSVSGNISNGVFNAYAYKNSDTGASGDSGVLVMFIIGIAFPIAGIYALFAFSNPFFGLFPKVIGMMFVLIGMYTFYRGLSIQKAINLLKSV